MIYYTITESPYKLLSVSLDENSVKVRIFRPTICCLNLIGQGDIHSESSILNRSIIYNDKPYNCAHELVLSKSDNIWQVGKHLIIYTTPDLYTNGKIGIADKNNIQHLNATIPLVELLCPKSNISFLESDVLIHAPNRGSILSNKQMIRYSYKDNFDFITSISGPKEVIPNTIFDLELSIKTPSGAGITGNQDIITIAGYIPNRRINFKNGVGKVKCTSLLCSDSFIASINNCEYSVKVIND